MAKRICAVLLILSALLAFSACGSAAPLIDSQDGATSVRIEDYLSKAENYFSVPETGVIIPLVKKGEDVLEVCTRESKSKDELPAELVDSYINSFKAYFGDAAKDLEEGKLKEYAESQIKQEMVVYILADRLRLNEISDADLDEMAGKLANDYSVDKSAVYTKGINDYLVKCAVLEERVKEKLTADYENANKNDTSADK